MLKVDRWRALRIVAPLSLFALPVFAQSPDLSKYPLRVQVLASTAHTRMPTNPFSGGGGSGEGMDMPNLMGSGPSLERDSIPVFYGQGWGDIVSSDVPQALTFSYDECANRVAVSMPHEPLAARWKKSGKATILEVLVPLEVIPAPGHPEQLDKKKYDKCDMPVTLHDYVYLRLQNGSIVKVSRAGYLKKPALRQFIDGMVPTLKMREGAVTPDNAANPDK